MSRRTPLSPKAGTGTPPIAARSHGAAQYQPEKKKKEKIIPKTSDDPRPHVWKTTPTPKS
jgi:hypothetical protein